MDIKTEFTSAEVLANPESTQDAFSCGEGVMYQMTAGELNWLDYIRGKYSIADYLDERLDGDMVLIDQDFSAALDEDCKGAGKAVMLADNTALQAIFFFNYREQ